MRLGAPESEVVAPPNCGASGSTFGTTLLLVVPVAQGPQIAVLVVVTTVNVVYIGRQLFTADALVDPGAAVAVLEEDATADRGPVVGKALAPVTASPLGHAAPPLV
jgi:hypothetical protein